MRDNSANITSEPAEPSCFHLISATSGVSADSGVQRPGLSHAPDEGPSNTSHDAAAQALPSTYLLPTSTHHSLLFNDVGLPVESPSQEPDETDVLNALLSDGHAAHLTGAVESFSSAAAAAVPAWISSRSGAGSYSSYRSWRPSQDGSRSVNPVHEVAESLRSVDSLGLGSEAASLSSSPVRRDMMEDGDLVMGEQDGGGGQQRSPPPPRQDNTMDSSLPGDDGMRALRVKLHEIRTLAASTEEKARRMHQLMVRDYEAHQANKPAILSTDIETGGTFEGPVDPHNPYRVQDADLEASFSPLPVRPREPDGDRDESMVDDITITLGCAHYKRNVKVQCFDCRLWFTCRHCHDQSPTLPFPHRLNRKKTQNMLCMLCRTPQPAGELCINCGEYAAWYYCPKCKLWDNDNNKRIYHCDDCGICRVGEGLGKDYVHCRRCNVCISISTSASHPCIERATEGDCPLCLVRLFESPTPVVSLPCGHYMHGECYRDLMAVTYKCPVCSRSAVNMELQWRKLDDEIRAQPMPEDDEDLEGLLPHAASIAAGDDDVVAPPTPGHVSPATQPRRPRTVYIGCNDCGRRSWAPFHWLGLKCQVCDSYNTNQMAPTVVQETEAERLIRQQAQHHRQHDFTGNSVLRDAGIGADDAAVEDVLLDVNTATLQVPTSPSQVPVNSERRASGAQSPGRRYFVQQEEERRPSFTMTPRFPTPSLPNLPNLPNLPDMPRLPRMPHMPNMPNMPNIPNLELGRFSPYEMLDAMSRSLSPMRYYLQGLDVGEGGPSHRSGGSATEGGGRNRSPASVRSDPTGVSRRFSSGKRRAGEGEAGDWLWGEESDADSEEDGDGGEGTDGSIRAVRRGEGEGETSEEESSSGSSEEDQGDGDAEMVDEDGDGEEEEDEEMELFGHRVKLE
ncbi:hypothetical protein LTR54_004289 [Friedmanniomyces endolithicus]|nr:hypothetical protein LTR54_004289 [Friedmanniomyces endolithicus]